ncbi:PIG-L family deacetylase [Streptomyces sp. NPDC051219]|uniref:PIG-L family deacetylase n=1 Tax=Streptomyces sp. NPDC051219 TaxID=3155283 RepID=UPI00344232B3
MSAYRRVLCAALLIALLAGATGIVSLVGAGEATSSESSTTVPVPPTRTSGESVMQIVAHPDDDLFFMNPDLSQSIAARRSLTSVYLTAGESDGVNAAKGPHLRDPEPRADKARYAEARQNGIRAAYAQMATGNRTSPWQRSVIRTAGGGTAELDVLKARPELSLVWVQLREAGSIAGDRPHSLHGLWDGRVYALRSRLSSGTPVRTGFSYTKEQTVRTITGLLERFRPTFVRMQDPTPGRSAQTHKYSDHQDHMYGARFVQAALARYARSGDRPHFSVQNYLGYLNGGLPHALDPAAAAAKLSVLKTYAWMDHTDYCGSDAGCGDRKVAARPAGRDWAQSIRYARGESTSWLQAGPGGGQWAFAVLDGRLAVWQRPGGDTAWTGPRLLPGAGIDPGVRTAKLPDGRIAAFATRTTLGAEAAGYRRAVVVTVQRTPGGGFGPWQSLGTPERDDETWTSAISAPAVTVDTAGRMTVLLRDGSRTLSARAQRADGSWGPWRSLGGKALHGDPVTATDRAGRSYVFAATPTSVLVWPGREAPGTQRQGERGPAHREPARQGPARQGPFPTGLPPTTGPLTAVPDGDGVRLYFRKPDSGDVRTALVSAGGALPVSVSPVVEAGGKAGFGPVSASGSLLAARSGTGALAVRPGSAPGWTTTGPMFAGAPASVPQSSGTIGLAVLGLDARLHWTTTANGSLAPWQAVGR